MTTLPLNIKNPFSIGNYFKGFYQEISAPISNALTAMTDWVHDEDEISINFLDKLYLFSDYLEIYSFLKSNKFLISLLFEAHSQIYNFFPSTTTLTLKLEEDMDYGDTRLFIKISSYLPIDKSMELLDLVDEKWWADAVLKSDLKLSIDLEY